MTFVVIISLILANEQCFVFLVVQYNKFKLFTEKDSFVFLVATSIKIIRALIYYNLRTDLSGLYIFKYVFMELFTKKKKNMYSWS